MEAAARAVRSNGRGDSVPSRTAIVVLGMHRSGTSAMARILSLTGAALPRNVMPSDPGNPKGHWEPERVVTLHDEMLADASSAWQDVSRFPPSWYRSAAESKRRKQMVELLREEYGGSPLFVLKDPRMCRLVPFWLGVFAELDATPSFVLVVRNPLEVASSLKQRDGLSMSHGLLLWLRHVIDAERDTRGHPRAFISYARLLGDWEREARSVAQQLDLSWPRLAHRARAEVEGFLSVGDRHYVASPEELAAHTAVVSWVTRAFDVLMHACEAGEAPPGAVLDEIGSLLDEADAAYGPLLAEGGVTLAEVRTQLAARTDELERRTQEAEGRAQELDSTRLELHELQGQLADAVAGRDAAVAEATNKAAELAAVATEVAELRKHGDAVGAELQAVREQVASTSERLTDAVEERDAAREEIRARSREIERLRGELGDRHTELGQARERLLEAEVARATAEAQLHQTDAERARLTADAERLQRELERVTAELTQRDETLDRAEVEATRLTEELAAREEDVDRLEKSLEARTAELERTITELRESGAKLGEAEARRAALSEPLDSLTRERDELAEQLSMREANDEALRRQIDALDGDLTRLQAALESVHHETALAYLQTRPAGKLRAARKLLSWIFPIPRTTGRRYVRTFFALRGSKEFDFGYYLTRYPDVAMSRQHALMHYIEHGVRDGRDPNPTFSTTEYLRHHPELGRSGENPLLHYLRGDAGARAAQQS